MTRKTGRGLAVAIAAGLAAVAASAERGTEAGDWPQWGGPHRNFQAAQAQLAESWSESGPRVLWRRTLGDGNSAITIVGPAAYTLYREGTREVVVALDRATGETIWETSWEPRTWDGFLDEFGHGPHSTPLVSGGRLWVVGLGGRLVCLDTADGRELWSRDLWARARLAEKEFGPPQLGYSASPLLVDGRLVVLGGDVADGVQALDPATGEPLWIATGLEPSFASPIAIAFEGESQVVVFTVEGVSGLDAATGEPRWHAAHQTPYVVNASTPVWDGKDTLFISSAYDTGSRGLRLRRKGAAVEAEELWTSRTVQVHHQSAVLIDDVVYASSGDFGPAFLIGVRKATGEILFRERGFAKASLVASGDRVVILDEDGVLALATASAVGLSIDARSQVFDSRSWTAPTLIGTTLYARDRAEIAAFDLGPGSD